VSDARGHAAFKQSFTTPDINLDAVKRDLARCMIQVMERDPAFAFRRIGSLCLPIFCAGS